MAIELGECKVVPLNAELVGVVRLRHQAGIAAADGIAAAPIGNRQLANGPLAIQCEGLSRDSVAQAFKAVLLGVDDQLHVCPML